MGIVARVLSPIVDLRPNEAVTAILLFAYSFLAMAVWNTIKPLTRSQFIRDLGADNLPYVLLAAGLVIGVLMAGYAWLMARLPRRWGLPIVQAGMAGLLIVMWLLLASGAVWVSVVFYVVGLIFGLLLISQFWTVANLVYDPRQAKRLFGFVGGGAPLGGMAGSAFAAVGAARLGSLNLLLPSAAVMLLAAGVTAWIVNRERLSSDPTASGEADEPAVGIGEAWRMLQTSSHLKLVALLIAFSSMGAAIVEQQLNMAAEAHHGSGATDAITSALAWVGVWTSVIGLLIQVWLTSRIHRYLGVGFALMVLPLMLGTSAVVMLLNAALWAPALARVGDQSLRYTLDKTSREILFLPLPDALKLKAKPFVDVSVDRAARAGAALLLIVLVQPWALNLDWQSISYASLTIMGLWLAMAQRARRGYLRALRQSIAQRDLAPAELRLSGADLTTVETLVQELAHADACRVLYAIDVLESLDKRHLVTPLLLRHESPAVRERALRAMAATPSSTTSEWLSQIRRLLEDDDPGVRAAAVRTIAAVRDQDALARARTMAREPHPRIRATAAVVLAASPSPDDVALAEDTLIDLAGDTSEHGRAGRREVATALREIADPRFRRLLISLLNDPALDVAEAAARSVQAASEPDVRVVSALVSLLGNRQLKGHARDVLVALGEWVVDALALTLGDRDADLLVRRHLPCTLARIPSQRSVDALVEALGDADSVIRFKATVGLQRLRQNDGSLTIPRTPVEMQAIREARDYFACLAVHVTLFRYGGLDSRSLLAHALEDKMDRAKRRIYGLLCLVEPWQDVVAAEDALDRGDAYRRSSASEYLDNLLPGDLRRWLMPVLEDLPIDQKVRRGQMLLGLPSLEVDDTLRRLMADDDDIVAAAAIDLARRIDLVGDNDDGVPAGLWPGESLPAVRVADRLRALPLFANVSVDELFRIAGTSSQTRHEPGALLAREGVRPECVHVLLEGTAAVEGRHADETITSPALLGFAEALRALPMPHALRAESRSITLPFGLDELLMHFADNPQLVEGLFATITDGTRRAERVIQRTAGADEFARFAADGVAPGEKLVILEYVPLFVGLSADDARRIADIARTVRLMAGSPLFARSAPAAIWIVLDGRLAIEGPGGETVIASAGDVVGALATLAGDAIERSGRVVTSGIALRIDHEDLVDLCAERPTLLRQLVTTTLHSVDVQRTSPVSAAAARPAAVTA